MHLMTASLVALAAKLAAGAVADVLPRDSILNQIAWVDQLYTFNNHAKGNLCGDTHDLENHSGDKDAALSVDCLAMLNKINDVKDKAYYSLDSNWPQRADIKTGFAPLITVETCTFSIRPTSFNAVSYAYFVGAQDMSDILHTLINQYQQADHFKANGYMPCTDKYIKMQGDYELEFKIWNPKAQ
ncbi:hypothetical protein PFICI_14775 [Pestalotiopsis fici W106-1]|uniref:Ecp2 effector protein-like domain-containing protein n=1 Tax=Pestalotiopsis fici (strain W106-1 / CGMCC3.15140) TaxID=1229662 RepID=W3WJ90_PESFW|nr:uncharacterized protein PFICI_14775 [Pestalotiopsis fici W106-1]ETS73829.1 hypothetical protein PFICI_14775 [Pestalotiopsis fici W106-1]